MAQLPKSGGLLGATINQYMGVAPSTFQVVYSFLYHPLPFLFSIGLGPKLEGKKTGLADPGWIPLHRQEVLTSLNHLNLSKKGEFSCYLSFARHELPSSRYFGDQQSWWTLELPCMWLRDPWYMASLWILHAFKDKPKYLSTWICCCSL